MPPGVPSYPAAARSVVGWGWSHHHQTTWSSFPGIGQYDHLVCEWFGVLLFEIVTAGSHRIQVKIIMSESSEVINRREGEELLTNKLTSSSSDNLASSSSREVVGTLPSCLAGSRDSMVGNHLAHRRLSLPVSFDLRSWSIIEVVTNKMIHQVVNISRFLRGTAAP